MADESMTDQPHDYGYTLKLIPKGEVQLTTLALGMRPYVLIVVDSQQDPDDTEPPGIDVQAGGGVPQDVGALVDMLRAIAYDLADTADMRGEATSRENPKTVERLCEVMHDAYEQAAAGAGWETQQASRKPWSEVPEPNRVTMRAAVAALLAAAA